MWHTSLCKQQSRTLTTFTEDAHLIDAEELAAPVVVLKILHQQINKFSDCPEAIGSVSLLALLLLLWCNLASVILVQIERDIARKRHRGITFATNFAPKLLRSSCTMPMYTHILKNIILSSRGVRDPLGLAEGVPGKQAGLC